MDIAYKNLPQKGCSSNTRYHPRNIAVRLRAKLKGLDPNQNGLLTKAEVVKHYGRPMWAKVKSSYQLFNREWLRMKSRPCGCHPGDHSYSRTSKLNRLAAKVFPTPKIWMSPTSRSYVKGWMLKVGVEYQRFTISSRRNQLSDTNVTVTFKRLHPVKSCVVERSLKTVKVIITHYNNTKTILHFNPRTLKIVGSPGAKAPAIQKITSIKPRTVC